MVTCKVHLELSPIIRLQLYVSLLVLYSSLRIFNLHFTLHLALNLRVQLRRVSFFN